MNLPCEYTSPERQERITRNEKQPESKDIVPIARFSVRVLDQISWQYRRTLKLFTHISSVYLLHTETIARKFCSESQYPTNVLLLIRFLVSTCHFPVSSCFNLMMQSRTIQFRGPKNTEETYLESLGGFNSRTRRLKMSPPSLVQSRCQSFRDRHASRTQPVPRLAQGHSYEIVICIG